MDKILKAMAMGGPSWFFFAPDGGASGGDVGKDGAPGGDGQEDDGKVAPPEGGRDSGGQMYTQSDVDRAISQALATREKKLKEEAEQQRLKEKEEYQQLYETEAQKRAALELRSSTQEALVEKGLTELGGIFDADMSTIEGRVKVVEDLKGRLDKLVEAEVTKRLNGSAPPGRGRGAEPGRYTAEDVAKMSPSEYREARKKGLIK